MKYRQTICHSIDMKDEVIAYKNLCKSYLANKRALQRINDRIADTYYLLSGLSRHVEGERVQGSSDPHIKEQKKLEAYERIGKLEQRADRMEASIEMVDDVLSLMDRTARNAIIAIYINHQRTEQEEAEMVYMSLSTLKRLINRSIEKALDRYNEL